MNADPIATLGAFSISLTVKDLAASRAFYEKLGFAMRFGDGVRWALLQNGEATLGLFEGMFERNMLTFNPGWDRNGQNVEPFVDIREIQARLTALGIEPTLKADPTGAGPAHITIVDPDGNPILIDQHR